MKKSWYLIALFFLPFVSHAQDTLFVKKKAPVICKIVEIGIDEIKYKAWDNLEGPVIVVLKRDVYKISYQNGKSEFVEPMNLILTRKQKFLIKNPF